MQVLQDPNWLALILTVVTSFFSFVGWILERLSRLSRRKQITFKLKVASIALLSCKAIRGRITFGNNPQPVVNNIYLLTLDVKNTGGQNITSRDYVPPSQLRFELGTNTRILEAEVTKCPRGQLSVPTPAFGNLTIAPFTLQPKDVITVHMLVTDWAAKIENLTRLNDVQQILLFKPLSRLNIKNHIIRAVILCALQLCMFFLISYYMLGLYVVQIPQETDQSLGFSLAVGGLIATLMSIAIIFMVCDIMPFNLRAKKHEHELEINKKSQFFAARHLPTACLLFIISPCAFYFSNIFILNNAFNFDLVNSPFIGYSILLGGLATTLLIIIINFLLSWFFPLREFVGG